MNLKIQQWKLLKMKQKKAFFKIQKIPLSSGSSSCNLVHTRLESWKEVKGVIRRISVSGSVSIEQDSRISTFLADVQVLF